MAFGKWPFDGCFKKLAPIWRVHRCDPDTESLQVTAVAPYAAWRCIQGLPDIPGELALEGVTQIEGTTIAMFKYLNNLPKTLESLTFGDSFNQSLKQVTLPNSLQSLTFGSCFNQSLQGVTLPSNLQSLTFGNDFNQGLEQVTLPCNFQSLTFGEGLNWSPKRVVLPRNLQCLTLLLECKGCNRRSDLAKHSAELDIWPLFQPKP